MATTRDAHRTETPAPYAADLRKRYGYDVAIRIAETQARHGGAARRRFWQTVQNEIVALEASAPAPKDRTTAAAYVAGLRETSQAYHDQTIDFETFNDRQYALWRKIEARGQGFRDRVDALLRGDR
jgi:hypothetical protein